MPSVVYDYDQHLLRWVNEFILFYYIESIILDLSNLCIQVNPYNRMALSDRALSKVPSGTAQLIYLYPEISSFFSCPFAVVHASYRNICPAADQHWALHRLSGVEGPPPAPHQAALSAGPPPDPHQAAVPPGPFPDPLQAALRAGLLPSEPEEVPQSAALRRTQHGQCDGGDSGPAEAGSKGAGINSIAIRYLIMKHLEIWFSQIIRGVCSVKVCYMYRYMLKL